MDFDAIITGIRKAIYGREVREYIASSMEWTRDFVNQSIANIKELLRQAEAARDAAKASQDAAKVSETNAKASENAARASQNAAASSASAAAGSASAAKTSETNAKASENAAKTSETKAKTSETNAKASETKAKASADSMGTSVATCTAKAKEAEASAGKAKTSEGNAKTSEGNAKASENEARQLVEAAKKVVNTDKTLTIDGAPADAKTVGDKFKSIKTDWNSVTDKPSTFPSTWDSVSGKPSNYPPSAHSHSAANITSGILGLARGGTGCSTALDACKTLLWRDYLYGAPNWDALDTGIWLTTPEHWGTNGPSGVYQYGIVMVWNYSDNVTQVYIAHSTGVMAFRQRWTNGNSFSGWAYVNTNTITSQTSDPGAGSSLATGSILLVYA